MSFEQGSVTFRMFYLYQALPHGYVERFARRALPPIATLGSVPMQGWVTGRHLMDSNITEETAHYAGYLRLAFVRAERVIPASTLKAECRIEELARMQAGNRAELDRRTRAEIRKEVEARLLPTCPPQLKGIAVVHNLETCIVLCEATSDKQVDAMNAAFREVLGFGLIPVTPNNAAAKRLKIDARDIPATSFSPDCEDDAAEQVIGQDFLTWLWFFSETKGGIIKTEYGEFAVMIEGPLTFVNDGQGAHEAILRNGTPEISTEAKTSLLSGKKLCKSKLLLARGKDTWQVSIDANAFVFRGLRLPEGEKLDPVSRFQERLVAIGTFTTAFLEIFDRFLRERTMNWDKTREEIHEWVSERTCRK